MSKKNKLGFKKLQWKLILIFLMLVLSVMIIAGTFLLNGVLSYYHTRFKDTMNKEFSGIILNNLEIALASDEPEEKIIEVMEAFSTSRLGTNENRSYYILSANNGEFVHSSLGDNVSPDLTSNILTAMEGNVGDEVSLNKTYMDFAYPVKDADEVKYIIYVKDLKQEIKEVSRNLITVILQAIVFASIMAMILGVFLSRSISGPIRNLTESASKMADGDFGASIAPEGNDEIGILTNTFNTMASKLKTTLDEISGEKDKIEVVLKNMADGIIAFDYLGNSVHINPAAEKMFSLQKGKTYKFSEFFEKLGIEVKLEEALLYDDKTGVNKTFTIEDTIINAHFAPYKIEQARTEGIIVAFQDITKQQKLDNSRRAFVADVSHELRTPITNIKSYSETLLDAQIDDEETKRSFLSVINSEADRMTRLVKDLLVLSQLDYSKTQFKFDDVNIRKLIEDVVNAMKIEAKNRNLTFEFIARNNVPETVELDRDRINQVITNIVSNAFKFTKDGGAVTVILSAVEDKILISVMDTGIGIPQKDLPMIFERFYRVDKARSREQGGTGLGLAIAREIVKAHNGNITIESVYKKGSTVTITLPVKQSLEE